MVKSEKIYSPQKYLELITGNCYIIKGDNDVKFIENILKKVECNYWNYPLSEIEHIVENELDVVLVECEVWNKNKNQFEHEYRWFEAPDDTEPDFVQF